MYMYVYSKLRMTQCATDMLSIYSYCKRGYLTENRLAPRQFLTVLYLLSFCTVQLCKYDLQFLSCFSYELVDINIEEFVLTHTQMLVDITFCRA